MQTMGRILVILLAAAIVVGAAWALTRNTESAQTFPAGAQFRPGDDFNSEEFAPLQQPEGLREGGFERGRGDFRLFGWVKNVGVIAVIVAIVLFIERLLDGKRASRVTAFPPGKTQPR